MSGPQESSTDRPEGGGTATGPDADRRGRSRPDRRTPPHPAMTAFARWGYAAALLLALLTVGLAPREPLETTPGMAAGGALLVGVLCYQAGFLLYYTGAATDAGVLFPRLYGVDGVTSGLWARVLAGLTALAALVVAAALL